MEINGTELPPVGDLRRPDPSRNQNASDSQTRHPSSTHRGLQRSGVRGGTAAGLRGSKVLPCLRTTRDANARAAVVDPSAGRGVVVGLVGMQRARLAQARTTAGPDRRQGCHQRLEFLSFVGVDRGDPHHQRQPCAFSQNMIFEPELPRSTGLGPLRDPLFGPDTDTVDDRAGPVERSPAAEFVEGHVMEFSKHSNPGPLGKASMRGLKWHTGRRRQIPTRTPHRPATVPVHHPADAGETAEAVARPPLRARQALDAATNDQSHPHIIAHDHRITTQDTLLA